MTRQGRQKMVDNLENEQIREIKKTQIALNNFYGVQKIKCQNNDFFGSF